MLNGKTAMARLDDKGERLDDEGAASMDAAARAKGRVDRFDARTDAEVAAARAAEQRARDIPPTPASEMQTLAAGEPQHAYSISEPAPVHSEAEPHHEAAP